MKRAVLFLCAFTPGCVSRREVHVVPPIRVAVDIVGARRASDRSPIVTGILTTIFDAAIGPETAVGQMLLGCGHFYGQMSRWPRTKEEVAAGLRAANLPPVKLEQIEELKLREDGGALIIDYVSSENAGTKGTITLSPKNA